MLCREILSHGIVINNNLIQFLSASHSGEYKDEDVLRFLIIFVSNISSKNISLTLVNVYPTVLKLII